MPDIFLVRHGEAAASWGEATDPGLSERGQAEAEQAARVLLRQVPADTLIISSPLARAQETAAPLARDLGQGVEQDAVFREVPSPVPLAERQAWLRQFMQQQWHEQGDELVAWRDHALQRLLGLDRTTVVFTHFLVINAVVGQVLQRPETLCFWPDNGSITRLRLGGGKLELLALGEEVKTVIN